MAAPRRQRRRRDAARRGRFLTSERTPLDQIVRDRIRAEGPLPFRDVLDLALYDPEHGFYTSSGHAGRGRGDFITSPEVGPLFGRLVAAHIDEVWERLGRPSPFAFVEVGAGPGTLARSVRHAEPNCLDALDYVAVEVSDAQRAQHPDGIRSVPALPPPVAHGVVFANEVLDNVAFSPVESGRHLHVDVVDDDLVLVPGGEPVAPPSWTSARDWIDQSDAAAMVEKLGGLVAEGELVVIDYARAASSEVRIRTYRGHERGVAPLTGLGSQDITVDVDLAQLSARYRAPDETLSQAEWLRRLGIDELVDEGERIWRERAGIGDLVALEARSRAVEAEALLDPAGFGTFAVLRWVL